MTFEGKEIYDNVNKSIFLNNPYCSGHKMCSVPVNGGNRKQPDYEIFKILNDSLKIDKIEYNNKWKYTYKDIDDLQERLTKHKIKIIKIVPGFQINNNKFDTIGVDKPTKYGTVYLQYTAELNKSDVSYSYNIEDCIDREIKPSWLEAYNVAVNARIQNDLKEMKDKILNNKGRKISSSAKVKEGTNTTTTYETIVSDGLYEMMKNAAILCNGNKEQTIALINKNYSQIVLELTDEEKSLVKIVCGGDK